MAKEAIQNTTLASALVDAQRAISAVGKDATNSHHKYAYVSAEAMIGAARTALGGAGLALVRHSVQLHMEMQPPIITSSYALIYASGERMDFLDQPWFVLEGNGRPLDKAMAGALTTSMAYFLRDLLLIPKEDESEVDRRDDTQHKGGTLGVSGAVSLRRKLSDSSIQLRTLVTAMSSYGINVPDDVAQWDAALLPRIMSWIAARKNQASELQDPIQQSDSGSD